MMTKGEMRQLLIEMADQCGLLGGTRALCDPVHPLSAAASYGRVHEGEWEWARHWDEETFSALVVRVARGFGVYVDNYTTHVDATAEGQVIRVPGGGLEAVLIASLHARDLQLTRSFKEFEEVVAQFGEGEDGWWLSSWGTMRKERVGGG